MVSPLFYHIPPHYVVERFICSSQAARGEDLQVEHPVCGCLGEKKSFLCLLILPSPSPNQCASWGT